MWGGLSAVCTQNIYYHALKYPAARCAVEQFIPSLTNNLPVNRCSASSARKSNSVPQVKSRAAGGTGGGEQLQRALKERTEEGAS